jgi:hypothetical protein
MLIRTHNTGLELSPAPEFGRDGSWPPAETEWVPVRWELFEAQAHDTELSPIVAHALALIPDGARLPPDAPVLTEDALSNDFLYDALFAHISDVAMSWSITNRNVSILVRDSHSGKWDMLEYTGKQAMMARKELRRLVHYLRWRRQDPVIRLPPAATNTIGHSVTTGLSIEHSQTLAESLGLNLGNNVAGVQAKLSSQLQQQFRLSVEITAQEQRNTELALANPSHNRYRLFALWHVDHLIRIDALSPSFSPDFRPVWVPRGSAEFVTESAPHVTYAEVRRT